MTDPQTPDWLADLRARADGTAPNPWKGTPPDDLRRVVTWWRGETPEGPTQPEAER